MIQHTQDVYLGQEKIFNVSDPEIFAYKMSPLYNGFSSKHL